MAGGDVNIVRQPYPNGADSVVVLQSSILTQAAAAALTNFRFCEMTVPFKCRVVYAERTAQQVVDADADGTVTVFDDSGTPKVVVTPTVIGAVTSGTATVKALTVDATKTLFAGSLLRFEVTTPDAADQIVGLQVTLWVQPVTA